MLKNILDLGKNFSKNEQKHIHGGGPGLSEIYNRNLASCLNFCTAPNTECCLCSDPDDTSATHTYTFTGF